jgi:hypothetical protein
LTAGERFTLGLAVLAAAASLGTAVVGPIVSDSVEDGPIVSCPAEQDPRVAHLYANGDPDLPTLFSEEEEEVCGDPQHLLESLEEEGSSKKRGP